MIIDTIFLGCLAASSIWVVIGFYYRARINYILAFIPIISLFIDIIWSYYEITSYVEDLKKLPPIKISALFGSFFYVVFAIIISSSFILLKGTSANPR